MLQEIGDWDINQNRFLSRFPGFFACHLWPTILCAPSGIKLCDVINSSSFAIDLLCAQIRTTKKSENYFISELKYIAMDNVQLNDIFLYEETSLKVVEQLVATGHYGSAKNMEEILDMAKKRASIVKRRIELLERSFYDQSAGTLQNILIFGKIFFSW